MFAASANAGERLTMGIAELLSIIKADGFPAVLGVVVIYVLIRGEITFRYPSGSKRKR